MAINPNPKSEKNRINKSKESELEKNISIPFSSDFKYLRICIMFQNKTFYMNFDFFFSLNNLILKIRTQNLDVD